MSNYYNGYKIENMKNKYWWKNWNPKIIDGGNVK